MEQELINKFPAHFVTLEAHFLGFDLDGLPEGLNGGYYFLTVAYLLIQHNFS